MATNDVAIQFEGGLGMTSDEFILEATNIAKKFGQVIALRDANLRLRRGEVHGLLGANGAGKSTFVKTLTGAIGFGTGSILLDGKPFSARSPADARSKGVVSIYQEPSLVPHLTIAENMKLSRAPMVEVMIRLEKYGLGNLDVHARVKEFALPIRRMIDIARSLASNPKVVFFDEATAALSAEYADMVFQEVRDLQKSGVAVVYISHRLAEIELLCGKSTVLRDGKVAGVVDTDRESSHKIVQLMLGEVQASEAKERKPVPSSAATMLSVEGLGVGHQLSNISLSIAKGEVLGLVALEGQGQEQLFECLVGARRPDSGNIVVAGQHRQFRHPVDAIDAGIAFVPAEREKALLPHRSVAENIWLPMLRSPMDWGLIPEQTRRRAVDKVVTSLSIDMRAASEVSQLSGGNQQKVVIARWMSAGFDILLCFDPTRGIDVGAKRQVFDLVREVASGGASVLYFTSDLTEIEQVADRAVVLFGGQIVARLPLSDCSEAKLLQAAHGLAHAEESTEVPRSENAC
jgi:ribose transport system ATP-binding protein